MVFFTIRYMNALLLLLSLAFMMPAPAASTGSAIARSSRNKGFQNLPDELNPDFFKRQITTPPATTPVVAPPASPSAAAPPPDTTVVAPPASPSEPPPSSASSAIQSPPSSSSIPVDPPPPASPSSPPSQSDPLIQPPSSSSSQSEPPPSSSSPQPAPSISPSSPSSQSAPPISPSSDPLIQPPSSSSSSSISSPGGSVGTSITDPASPAPSESIGNGTTGTSLSNAVITGDSTVAGGSTILSPPASPSGNLSPNDTSLPSSSVSSSVSYSLSYEFATVTGPGGSESISIGTVSVSQAVVPITSDPVSSAAPLVVQQALPDAPPTPVCQLQYLPTDAWETTGTSVTTATTTGTNGTTHQGVVSQCNNGTRVSNKVGSEINLKFIGTEVSLLMIPGEMGGAYDVKIDDGEPETLDNYKADATSCQVATPWSRTGLENKPHDITVIVKGSPAGSAGGSQIEFNGLIFKGPQTTAQSSGPNWIIIGASIGAGVVVLALIFIGVLCIRRRRAQRATPTPDPRPPSTVSSFRPQTLVSGHTRGESSFSAGAGAAAQTGPGHRRADSNFSNAPSGHYRGDSGFSGPPYGPASPLSALQQNPFGHSRQQSDAPLMMQQGQQTPWQIPATGVANIPPSGSPYHSNPSSPQPQPLTFVGYNNGQERQSMAGYGNVQERQSFIQTHGRATSYGSDERNPFE